MNSKDHGRTSKIHKALLNPLYTFDNFVVGDSNHFAFLAVKNASNNPEILYNPLFIQGGVGSGKTHLMHAIGNIMQAQGKKVIYTSIKDFSNDFVTHLNNRTMDRFRLKYHKCDLILLDDIQSLSNKEQTQEEIFNIIETFRAENKQIIIASDKLPKQIGGLAYRLESRFLSGLIVTIDPIDLETKIKILKKKCEINSLYLDDEIIHYIATTIDNNIYEIEGILTKLNAYVELMSVAITMDFVRKLLEGKKG